MFTLTMLLDAMALTNSVLLGTWARAARGELHLDPMGKEVKLPNLRGTEPLGWCYTCGKPVSECGHLSEVGLAEK